MILIAFVLIPQPMCGLSLWVAFACASIDFGVIGYMTLCGFNLDAISMITIIMSIGFSVDYSAHITYGYVVSRADDPRDKIKDVLSALGWPLFQGAMSTIVAVSVLADVAAYMIVTFFKTVGLAISIGLLHGLVFLPVLSIFVRSCCIIGTPHYDDHIIKAKITPMVKKGIFDGMGSLGSSAGYGTATRILSMFLESPDTDHQHQHQQQSSLQLSYQSPTVHNKSRLSCKSPEHLE